LTGTPTASPARLAFEPRCGRSTLAGLAEPSTDRLRY